MAARTLRVNSHHIRLNLTLSHNQNHHSLLINMKRTSTLRHLRIYNRLTTISHTLLRPQMTQRIQLQSSVTQISRIRTIPLITMTTTSTNRVQTNTLTTPLRKVIMSQFNHRQMITMTHNLRTRHPSRLQITTMTTLPRMSITTNRFRHKMQLLPKRQLSSQNLRRRKGSLSRTTSQSRSHSHSTRRTSILLRSKVAL